jgi:hypothetical protein
MPWEVEYTDEFEAWWQQELAEGEQDEIAAVVGLLERKGPHLPYPYSSGVGSSQHPHLRELRIQYRGNPYRILYAFDPRRIAVLLIGGCKTGRDRWYEGFVPLADKLYDEHLIQLRKEGLIP